MDNVIVPIDVTDGSLVCCKNFDCFESNFGIYKVQRGYIVYGEMKITMLDFKFNKTWSFSGKDIFLSATGKKPFELCDNSIKLYDFEDNFYEIDFDGNLISNT